MTKTGEPGFDRECGHRCRKEKLGETSWREKSAASKGGPARYKTPIEAASVSIGGSNTRHFFVSIWCDIETRRCHDSRFSVTELRRRPWRVAGWWRGRAVRFWRTISASAQQLLTMAESAGWRDRVRDPIAGRR
ncbi:hypothetical protein, partial [Bradyrhizobium sp. STM 3809]|uniref:hypothetical protein n=1 Tax=Bradyrhizobium sp. STM 3809 TaxID=551936 RepID=UPI001AEC2051